MNDCNTCSGRDLPEYSHQCLLCACGGSGYTPDAVEPLQHRRERTRRLMARFYTDARANRVRDILRSCGDLPGLGRFNNMVDGLPPG